MMLDYVIRNFKRKNKERIDKLSEEGRELFKLICDLIEVNNEEMGLFVENHVETVING